MSHNFQICPIDFALHGDNVPYDIFAFKITVGHISGMVGPIDVKRKGGKGYWVNYVTLTVDLTHVLDL